MFCFSDINSRSTRSTQRIEELEEKGRQSHGKLMKVMERLLNVTNSALFTLRYSQFSQFSPFLEDTQDKKNDCLLQIVQAVRLTASAVRSIQLTSMMAAQLAGRGGSMPGTPAYDRGCIVTILKVSQGTCLVAHDRWGLYCVSLLSLR